MSVLGGLAYKKMTRVCVCTFYPVYYLCSSQIYKPVCFAKEMQAVLVLCIYFEHRASALFLQAELPHLSRFRGRQEVTSQACCVTPKCVFSCWVKWAGFDRCLIPLLFSDGLATLKGERVKTTAVKCSEL